VLDQIVPTSTGTVDLTVSGKGTPKGFMVFASRLRLKNTNIDDIACSWGVCDLTNSHCVGFWAQDGSATQNTGQVLQNVVAYVPDPDDNGASPIYELSFVTTVTDGVRLSLDTAPPVLCSFRIVLFYGEDCEAFAFSAAAPGSSAPTTVTTGFEVDCGFTVNMHGTTAGEAEMKMQFGIFTQTDQAVSLFSCADGGGTSFSARAFFDDRISIDHDYSSSPGSVAGANIVENFTSTSFDIAEFSPAVGPGDRTVGLALATGVSDVHVEVGASTSTSVTSKAYNEASFEPEFVYLPVSNATSEGALLNVGGMSLAFFDANTQAVEAYSARSSSGTGTSDNDDRAAGTKALHLRNHVTGATIISAEIDEVTGSGFGLDFTDVVSPARLFAYLVIERGVSRIRGLTLAGSTVTGTIRAKPNPIEGSSAGAASVTGTLSATGAIEGASAGSATVEGTLQGNIALEASSAGAASVTGTLVGKGALDASSAGSSTVQGTLSATAAIEGTSAGAASVTGTLAAASSIEGASAGTSTTTATLVATGAIEGSSAGTATVQGTLSATSAIEGSSAGTVAVEGTLVGTGSLEASSAGQATVQGTLAAAGGIEGSADGAATVQGTLSATARIEGSTAGQATVTGAVQFDSLQGSAAGVATVTGTLSGTASIEGKVQAGARPSPSATLVGTGALEATAAGAATTSATLVGSSSLDGSSAGQATVEGTLEAKSSFSGEAAGVATVTGTLSATAAKQGTSAGTSTTTATLRAKVSISGSTAGQASTTATGKALGKIIGSISSVASTAATIAATAALSVSIAASASATADLSATARIQGSVAGTSTVTATGSGAPVAEVRDIFSLMGSRDVETPLVGSRDALTPLVGQRCTIVSLLGSRSLS